MSGKLDAVNVLYRFKYVVAIALVAVLVTASAANIAFSTVSPSTVATINKWSEVKGCSYQNFTDGTTTYSQSCDDGTILSSSSSAASVIQNTINTLTSGGRIIVKTGTYSISANIKPASNIIIQGEGIGNTILQASSSNGIFVKNDATAMSNFMVTDMTLDGNNQNQKVVNFDSNASNFKLIRVYVKNAGNANLAYQVGDIQDSIFDTNTSGADLVSGIYTGSKITGTTFKNGSGQGLTSTNAQNVTITNNFFTNISTNAIVLSSSAGTIKNVLISGNVFKGSGSNDIQFYKSTNAIGNNTITSNVGSSNIDIGENGVSDGNIVVGNAANSIIVNGNNNIVTNNRLSASTSSTAAIYVKSGTQGNRIVGNYIAEANAAGIEIEGSDYNTVSGNIIVNNGRIATNTYNGIYLINNGGSTPDNNVVSGNSILAASSGNVARYGINHASGTGNIVADNQIVGTFGTGTANMVLDSTDITHHNKGFVTENTFTSGTFAIDSTGVKTVVTAHGLNYTPATDDCGVTEIEQTNESTSRTDWIKVVSTNSTHITTAVNIGIASGTGGATAKLGFVCFRG